MASSDVAAVRWGTTSDSLSLGSVFSLLHAASSAMSVVYFLMLSWSPCSSKGALASSVDLGANV